MSPQWDEVDCEDPDKACLGCVIPRFLSQINSASVSFGHLWFKDTQNIICFPENFFLGSPQDPPKSEKVDFQVAPITLLMVL